MMFNVKDTLLTILIFAIVVLGFAWKIGKLENESLMRDNKEIKVKSKVDIANVESKDLTDDLKQLKEERQDQLKRIKNEKNEDVNLSVGSHTIIIGR